MSRVKAFAVAISVYFVMGCLSPQMLHADATSARSAVDEAKHSIEARDWKQADISLRLADAELAGASDTEKTAIKAEIDETKRQLLEAQTGNAKQELVRHIEIQLNSAKQSIGDRGEMEYRQKELEGLLTSDDAKKFLTPADIEKYRRELSVYSSVTNEKADEQTIGLVKMRLEQAEKELPDTLKKIEHPETPAEKDVAVQRFQNQLDSLNGSMQNVPDSAAGKELRSRLAKITEQFNSVAASGESKEYVERIKNFWNDAKGDFSGWEQESTGPTFAQFVGESSEEMYALKSPKTIKMIDFSNQWLKTRLGESKYKTFQNDPAVKSVVSEVTTARDTGRTKLEKFTDAVISEAEKDKDLTEQQAQKLGVLMTGRLPDALEGSEKLKPLEARAKALVDRFNQNVAAAAAAQEAAYKQLTASAAAAWPAMAGQFNAEQNFDPNNYSGAKGKTIRLTSKNRMGFDFSPGDFEFATTYNGVPLAGYYDPVVKAAFTDVQKKIGRDIGDRDEDGEWDVIAIVEGSKGQLIRREQREAHFNGDVQGTVRGETKVPVEAPIIRIVAVHAGPLAVAVGVGAAQADGKVAAPQGGAGSSIGSGGFGGWMMLFCWTLIGLAGAATVLIKAQPHLAAQKMGAKGSDVVTTVNKNLDYIGLTLLVLGVLWLLRGWIYRDLLPAVSLIACGAYAASDFLKKQGWLKDAQYAQIAPFAMPLAVVTAALMVLHLFIGGWPFF